MKKRCVALLLCMAMTITMAACGQSTDKKTDASETADVQKDAEKQEEDDAVMELESIIIHGYEWGSAVDEIVVKPKEMPEQLNAEDYVITTAGMNRTITSVFASDEKGNADEKGKYLTYQMTVANHVGTPFVLDTSEVAMGMNKWAQEFVVNLSIADGKSLVVGDETLTGQLDEEDMIEKRISPETDIFEKTTVTGHETGKKKGEKLTIQQAAYEPEALKKDGKKNPLIIWLHGLSEGGNDIDLDLLGNEVTALTRDEIQQQFTTEGGNNGIYVLAFQSPTYWMQAADGSAFDGSADSIYRDVLTKGIWDYVKKNEDVDSSRIYIGGCSNGGYMTMNLLVHDEDNFFAAAYPVCEAYADQSLSEEEIASLAKKNIWFVQSANDAVVKPNEYGEKTYHRLLAAGAQNCWYSMYEKVLGTDAEGKSYNGHWSWINVFNNKVTKAQEPSVIKDSMDTKTYGFVPNNDGGGTVSPQGYATLFAWMNAQTNQ